MVKKNKWISLRTRVRKVGKREYAFVEGKGGDLAFTNNEIKRAHKRANRLNAKLMKMA